MVLSLAFILAFVGSAVALLIGILIFSEVSDAIICPITEEEITATWLYREHEINLTFKPRASFGVEVASPNRYETATGPPDNGVGNNYLFKTFKTSEITGSDINVIWEKSGGNGVTSNTFRIIDGAYDKDSLTDFVPGAGGHAVKGGGVLGSFSSFPNHAEQTVLLNSINWGNSILPDVTIIIFITDTNIAINDFDSLFIKEINVLGTPSGDNIKWEFLSPVVTPEVFISQNQDSGFVESVGGIAGTGSLEASLSCEKAKDTAWTVIGILPVALFFALFAIFGSIGGRQ